MISSLFNFQKKSITCEKLTASTRNIRRATTLPGLIQTDTLLLKGLLTYRLSREICTFCPPDVFNFHQMSVRARLMILRRGGRLKRCKNFLFHGRDPKGSENFRILENFNNRQKIKKRKSIKITAFQLLKKTTTPRKGKRS